MSDGYRSVNLRLTEQVLEDVAWAVSRFARFKGINGTVHDALLIHTNSIHTMSLSVPITVIAMTGDGMVLSTQVVPPRRILTDRFAKWMLELRDPINTPPVRSAVSVVASSEHDRNTCCVCHAHREPRRHQQAPRQHARGR